MRRMRRRAVRRPTVARSRWRRRRIRPKWSRSMRARCPRSGRSSSTGRGSGWSRAGRTCARYAGGQLHLWRAGRGHRLRADPGPDLGRHALSGAAAGGGVPDRRPDPDRRPVRGQPARRAGRDHHAGRGAGRISSQRQPDRAHGRGADAADVRLGPDRGDDLLPLLRPGAALVRESDRLDLPRSPTPCRSWCSAPRSAASWRCSPSRSAWSRSRSCSTGRRPT